MASDNEASCVTDPNFAVICSFLECFGKSCGLEYPDIARLQEMLENAQEVSQELVDLHIKLLRKARKSVAPEKWEKALVKFCHTYSNQDGWELERIGYKKARVAVKLRLLKALLETQFDMNQKFKNEVNKLTASELRLEPLGRDKCGLAYWCQLDEECNIRVYREDLDEESWELIAKTREEVVSLINTLTDGEISNIPISEDSNSLETSEKPTIDTGQNEISGVINGNALDIEKSEEANGVVVNKDIVTENLSSKKNAKQVQDEEENNDDEEELDDEEEDEEDDEEDDEDEDEEEEEEEDEEDEEDEESEDEQVKEENGKDIELNNVKQQLDQLPNKIKKIEELNQVTIHKVEIPTVVVDPPLKKDEVDIEQKNVVNMKNGVSVDSTLSQVKSIETPVITTSPLKLVNIADLKQSPEKKFDIPGKVPVINNLSYATTIEATSGHNKLPIKPIDQLAANLVRIQSEKLEKPIGKLEKIAETLAKGQVSVHNVLPNGDDDMRLHQQSEFRNQDKRSHRGIDLSTSPRGWETTPSDLSAGGVNARPVDFSGMDLSSRKVTKELPSPGAYRPQDFHHQQQQHKEMDLSTRKSGNKSHSNLPPYDSTYDARAVMMRNHAMVADLSKRQLPYSAYELPSSTAVPPYHASRHPKDIDPQQQRLPGYAMLPDPSKLAALRVASGSLKRSIDNDSLQATDVMLKRMRADIIPIRGNIDPSKLQQQRHDWREDVGEAIEEPVMMVHGEGSGSDCDAVNPLFEDAIEEPVMFFYGEGSGVECDTGNPADETSSTTENKETESSDKETLESSEACSSDLKSSKPKFKLGVQVFSQPITVSPVKRSSRWDVRKPDDKLDISPQEMQENNETTTSSPKFFFGPNCVSYAASKAKEAASAMQEQLHDVDTNEDDNNQLISEKPDDETGKICEQMVPIHIEEKNKLENTSLVNCTTSSKIQELEQNKTSEPSEQVNELTPTEAPSNTSTLLYDRDIDDDINKNESSVEETAEQLDTNELPKELNESELKSKSDPLDEVLLETQNLDKDVENVSTNVKELRIEAKEEFREKPQIEETDKSVAQSSNQCSDDIDTSTSLHIEENNERLEFGETTSLEILDAEKLESDASKENLDITAEFKEPEAKVNIESPTYMETSSTDVVEKSQICNDDIDVFESPKPDDDIADFDDDLNQDSSEETISKEAEIFKNSPNNIEVKVDTSETLQESNIADKPENSKCFEALHEEKLENFEISQEQKFDDVKTDLPEVSDNLEKIPEVLEETLADLGEGTDKSVSELDNKSNDDITAVESCSSKQVLAADDNSNLFDEDVFETKEQTESINNLLTTLEKDDDIESDQQIGLTVQVPNLLSMSDGKDKDESETKIQDHQNLNIIKDDVQVDADKISDSSSFISILKEDQTSDLEQKVVQGSSNEDSQEKESDTFLTAKENRDKSELRKEVECSLLETNVGLEKQADLNVRLSEKVEKDSNLKTEEESFLAESNVQTSEKAYDNTDIEQINKECFPQEESSIQETSNTELEIEHSDLETSKLEDSNTFNAFDKSSDVELEDTVKMEETFSIENTSRLQESRRYSLSDKSDEDIEAEEKIKECLPSQDTVKTEETVPESQPMDIQDKTDENLISTSKTEETEIEDSINEGNTLSSPNFIEIKPLFASDQSGQSNIGLENIDDKKIEGDASEVSSLIVECASVHTEDSLATDLIDAMVTDDKSCDLNNEDELETPQDISMEDKLIEESNEIEQLLEEPIEDLPVTKDNEDKILSQTDDLNTKSVELQSSSEKALNEIFDTNEIKSSINEEKHDDFDETKNEELNTDVGLSNEQEINVEIESKKMPDILKTSSVSEIHVEKIQEEPKIISNTEDNKEPESESDNVVESGYKSLVPSYDSDSNDETEDIFDTDKTDNIEFHESTKTEVTDVVDVSETVNTIEKETTELQTPEISKENETENSISKKCTIDLKESVDTLQKDNQIEENSSTAFQEIDSDKKKLEPLSIEIPCDTQLQDQILKDQENLENTLNISASLSTVICAKDISKDEYLEEKDTSVSSITAEENENKTETNRAYDINLESNLVNHENKEETLGETMNTSENIEDDYLEEKITKSESNTLVEKDIINKATLQNKRLEDLEAQTETNTLNFEGKLSTKFSDEKSLVQISKKHKEEDELLNDSLYENKQQINEIIPKNKIISAYQMELPKNSVLLEKKYDSFRYNKTITSPNYMEINEVEENQSYGENCKDEDIFIDSEVKKERPKRASSLEVNDLPPTKHKAAEILNFSIEVQPQTSKELCVEADIQSEEESLEEKGHTNSEKKFMYKESSLEEKVNKIDVESDELSSNIEGEPELFEKNTTIAKLLTDDSSKDTEQELSANILKEKHDENKLSCDKSIEDIQPTESVEIPPMEAVEKIETPESLQNIVTQTESQLNLESKSSDSELLESQIENIEENMCDQALDESIEIEKEQSLDKEKATEIIAFQDMEEESSVNENSLSKIVEPDTEKLEMQIEQETTAETSVTEISSSTKSNEIEKESEQVNELPIEESKNLEKEEECMDVTKALTTHDEPVCEESSTIEEFKVSLPEKTTIDQGLKESFAEKDEEMVSEASLQESEEIIEENETESIITESTTVEETKQPPVDTILESVTTKKDIEPVFAESSIAQESIETAKEESQLIESKEIEPTIEVQHVELAQEQVTEKSEENVQPIIEADREMLEHAKQPTESVSKTNELYQQKSVEIQQVIEQEQSKEDQEKEPTNETTEHPAILEKTVDESDDSMGCDNDESMFDAPPLDDVDPLADSEPDSTPTKVVEAPASGNVGSIRVKAVSELVGTSGGWKLDATMEPPPPPQVETEQSPRQTRVTRQSRKRRNSAQDSNSEDASIASHMQTDEDETTGGKRMKLRGKRTPDVQLRKSVEKNRKISASSEDDSRKASGGVTVTEEGSQEEIPKDENQEKPTISPSSKKNRGRPRGRKRKGRFRGRPAAKKPTEQAEDETVDEVADESADTNDVPADESATKKTETTSTETAAAEVTDKTKKKQRKKRNMVLGLEIPVDAMTNENEPPVRASRRIAQLKIKKEADRSRIEDEAQELSAKHKKDKSSKHSLAAHGTATPERKKRKKQKQESEEDAAMMKDLEKEEAKAKKKRRRRRKKKLAAKFNQANPWQSSSGSSSTEENDHEEDDEEIETDGEQLVFKSDHEFSPESDLEKDDQVSEPLRRARTAQKSKSDDEEDKAAVDEYACQKCSKVDHPEWILLCDGCDKGWHCSCLRPALMLIPEGDWYCPPCQHKSLVVKLQESLKTFDIQTKKHENELLRKKRLAYVGISLDNVLQKADKEKGRRSSRGSSQDEDEDESSGDESGSESSSEETSTDESEPVYQLRERRCANTYKFNEYDDMINAAIQDEVEAVRGAGNQGRGKDITTIVNAEKEEKAQSEAFNLLKEDNEGVDERKSEKDSDEDFKIDKEEDLEGDEDDDDGRAARAATRQKLLARKKHRKLNSLDISSEDDPYSDEDFKGSSSDEEEEDLDDQLSSTDDSDMGGKRRGRRGESRPVRRSTRARMTRYDEDFIDDDSEDSDRPKKKKSRHWGADSESEESDNSWRQKKKSRRTASTSRRFVAKLKPNKKKKKRKRIIANESDNDDDEDQLRYDVSQETVSHVDEQQPKRVPEVVPELQPEPKADLHSQMQHQLQEASELEIPSVPGVEPIVNTITEPMLECPQDIEMPIDESIPMEEELKPQETLQPQIPIVQQVVEPSLAYVPTPFDEEDYRKKKKEFQPKQKKIRRKVIYGRIRDENEIAEEDMTLGRRTRGRKISYLDAMPSDSDEELKKALRKTEETEEEFVVHANDDLMDDAEKDSDSGDVYSPKQQSLRAKNKSPKMRRGKKSPGAKRKSFSDDGMPRQRKKPGPKPGSKNKPRIRPGEDLGSIDPSIMNDADMLSGMHVDDPVQGVMTGNVTGEGSLASLGPSELEGLDEDQFEQMMMEDEEYGRRQLELAAIEIAKKKKKEEREAKKLEKARQKALEILAAERQESMNLEGTDSEIPKKKKRGRRSKAEILAEQMRRDASGVPPELLPAATLMGGPPPPQQPVNEVVVPAVVPNIPVVPGMEVCDQRMLENPMIPMMTPQMMDGQQPMYTPDGSPMKPKRRGRGKGKKTLAMEAARAAEAAAKVAAESGLLGMPGDSNSELSKLEEMQAGILPTPGSSTSGSAPSTPPAGVSSQGGPPSNQPSNPQAVYPSLPPQQQSSVITRMLQTQSVGSSPQSFTAAAAAMGHKYFGGPNAAGQMMGGPRPGYDMQNRGRIPSPYRQPGQQSMPPHFAAVRSGTPPGMRLRVPGAQMYHTPHHPMDPSPSGGGPISINNRGGDRSSPLGPGPPGPPMIPPSAGSPLSKGGPTPPPPYVRGVGRFGDSGQMNPRHPLPPFTNTSPGVVNHSLQQPSPPSNRGAATGNFSPYHPPPPPNYHYGAYPPPPPMSTADDAAAYQSSPYSSSAEQHFSSPGPDGQSGIQGPPQQPQTQGPQQAPQPQQGPQPQAGPPQVGPGPHPHAHPGHPGHPEGHPGHPGGKYDEEGSGEFGGLVSYFSSQREDDLES